MKVYLCSTADFKCIKLKEDIESIILHIFEEDLNCGKKRDFVHLSSMKKEIDRKSHPFTHGLRTSNEGINQRSLKIWADVADKICFGRT